MDKHAFSLYHLYSVLLEKRNAVLILEFYVLFYLDECIKMLCLVKVGLH